MPGVLIGLAPGLCLLALFLVLLPGSADAHGSTRRRALLYAGVLWGLWLVAGTELLSLGRMLTFWPVLAWWGAPGVVLAAIAVRRRRMLAERVKLRRPGAVEAFLAAIVASVLLATLLAAALSPPNNWDALAYHLPRQVSWMQQGSVAHFWTPNARQLMMPPLAEFAGLHLMLLSGGDRLANLVQWAALCLTAVLASGVAQLLGASRRGQWMAALVVVTFPAAAMQACNAKNDVVLALWVSALAYLGVLIVREGRCGAGRAAMVGGALGLLLLTKITGAVFALPMCAVIGGVLLVRRGRGALATGVVITACALAVIGPHLARNIATFGNPIGAKLPGPGFVNELMTPAALASVATRNIALHLGTPAECWNRGALAAVERLHGWLGLDVNDPRTTQYTLPLSVAWRPTREDLPGGPAHVLIAVLTLAGAGVWARRIGRNRAAAAYALVPFAAFLLFCAAFKWQPWHARLHIPAAVLLAPLAGLLLTRPFLPLGVPLAALAAAVVAPSLLHNAHKPLLGPSSVFRASTMELRFIARPDLMEPTLAMVDAAAALRPKVVGVFGYPQNWPYVLQRLALDRIDGPPLIVPFRGETSELTPVPDVIFNCQPSMPRLTHRASGIVWTPHWESAPLVLYVRQEPKEGAPVSGR